MAHYLSPAIGCFPDVDPVAAHVAPLTGFMPVSDWGRPASAAIADIGDGLHAPALVETAEDLDVLETAEEG